MWCNDEVKTAVRRKEAYWKDVLTVNDGEVKERCIEDYREEKIKVKR